MRRRRADALFDRFAPFETLCAAALRAMSGKRRVPRSAGFPRQPGTGGAAPQARAAGGDVAARRVRLLRDSGSQALTDLGAAVPRPDGAPRGARGHRASVRAWLHRPHLREPGGERDAPRRGALRAATRPPPRASRRHLPVLPAIDHEVLKTDLRRHIACCRTLRVLDWNVDTSNPQEREHLYYPGDDPFTPYERRRGLPIGNLTSQLFANAISTGSTTSSPRRCARRTCATWTTSRCSTTTRRGWQRGANARRRSTKRCDQHYRRLVVLACQLGDPRRRASAVRSGSAGATPSTDTRGKAPGRSLAPRDPSADG